MEKLITNWEVVEKRKRWRPRKIKTEEELLTTLKEKEAPIPDWNNFNIKTIAKLDQSTWLISMLNLKDNEKGEQYISIGWRKYYEYKGYGEAPNSMFMLKWKTLYIWDKIEWTTFRNGVSFMCSTFNADSVYVEERSTKYNTSDRALHLWKVLKSRNYTTSETLTTVTRNWKRVKITKEMVERFLSWMATKTEEICINYAKKINPEFCGYLESRMW